jgi:hypothetical protein
MIYFNTFDEAQAYADAVHAELSKNPRYIAERWSDVFEIQGKYGVYSHPCVEPSGNIDFVPLTENSGE